MELNIVKLIKPTYIKKHSYITFIIITLLISILFSTTALSLLGFYKVFNSYLGEEKDIIIIYDRKSTTPFTGLIPTYLAENISSIKGVIAVSPEIIVPCTIKNTSTFLRGIIPKDFTKLNQLTITEGSMLKLEDLNSIIIGKNLANQLNLKPGNKVLILSTLTNQYLELQIKGIFTSESIIDDEILAPLYIGQWLRGTDYNYVTLIRVKIDNNITTPSTILKTITTNTETPPNNSNQPPIGPIIPYSRPNFKIENIGINEAQKFMENYLNKYGITRETLTLLSIIVFLLSSTTIIIATKTILTQHQQETNILRSIGASKKTIKTDLLIKLSTTSLIASLIGILISTTILTIIQKHNYLQVLSHTIPIQPDPLIITLNLTLTFTIILITTLKSDPK